MKFSGYTGKDFDLPEEDVQFYLTDREYANLQNGRKSNYHHAVYLWGLIVLARREAANGKIPIEERPTYRIRIDNPDEIFLPHDDLAQKKRCWAIQFEQEIGLKTLLKHLSPINSDDGQSIAIRGYDDLFWEDMP